MGLLRFDLMHFAICCDYKPMGATEWNVVVWLGMVPTDSCIWTLGSLLVVLFGEVLELSGTWSLAGESTLLGTGWRVCSLFPLSGLLCCPRAAVVQAAGLRLLPPCYPAIMDSSPLEPSGKISFLPEAAPGCGVYHMCAHCSFYKVLEL